MGMSFTLAYNSDLREMKLQRLGVLFLMFALAALSGQERALAMTGVPGASPPPALDENHPSLPALSPLDMWNIDAKVDDGTPGTGQMVVYGTDSSTAIPRCTDASDSAAASATAARYLQTVTTPECAVIFRNQF
jgi:hypothetical protein